MRFGSTPDSQLISGHGKIKPDNVKYQNRTVFIYPKEDSATIAKIMIINKSMRSGKGAILTAFDQVEQTCTYHGIIVYPYDSAGNLDLDARVIIQDSYYNIRISDTFKDMYYVNTAQDYYSVGDYGSLRSGRNVFCPPPEWYSDEEFLINTDRGIDNHFRSTLLSIPINRDGYELTLRKIADRYTKILILTIPEKLKYMDNHMDMDPICSSIAVIHTWLHSAMLDTVMITMDMGKGYYIGNMRKEHELTDKDTHREEFVNLLRCIEYEFSNLQEIYPDAIRLTIYIQDNRVSLKITNTDISSTRPTEAILREPVESLALSMCR